MERSGKFFRIEFLWKITWVAHNDSEKNLDSRQILDLGCDTQSNKLIGIFQRKWKEQKRTYMNNRRMERQRTEINSMSRWQNIKFSQIGKHIKVDIFTGGLANRLSIMIYTRYKYLFNVYEGGWQLCCYCWLVKFLLRDSMRKGAFLAVRMPSRYENPEYLSPGHPHDFEINLDQEFKILRISRVESILSSLSSLIW